MNCEQARRLMHELLDGAPVDHAVLDQHLAQCAECQHKWQSLQRLAIELESALHCDVPAVRVQCATRSVLRALAMRRRASSGGLSRLAWAAAAALLIAIFATGLYAGRTVWPRELIVKVPEVHEKIVKVEVPVIKERVVIKHVPVYKTRIVYRDREVPEVAPVAERQREPVKCDEILVYLPSNPIAATAHVREEVQPAEVLDAGESDETPPTQGHWQPPDATTRGSAGAEMVIAQKPPD